MKTESRRDFRAAEFEVEAGNTKRVRIIEGGTALALSSAMRKTERKSSTGWEDA
jgi:hypothetical protein